MKGRYLFFALAISSGILLAGCGTKSQKASVGTAAGKAATTAPAPASAPKATAEGAKSLASAPSPIAAPKSYSADIVTSGPGVNQTSKLAIDGENKVRTEMAGQIVIMRKDKGKMWMLNRATKTATEMPINEQVAKDMEKGRFDRSKLKLIGQDTVDGYLCDKYLVTSQGTTATTWIAKKIGLPIKIESAGATIHFTNIKVGPQPASLFEVDPGYSIQQMPDMSKMGRSMPKPGSMPALPKGVTVPQAPR